MQIQPFTEANDMRRATESDIALNARPAGMPLQRPRMSGFSARYPETTADNGLQKGERAVRFIFLFSCVL